VPEVEEGACDSCFDCGFGRESKSHDVDDVEEGIATGYRKSCRRHCACGPCQHDEVVASVSAIRWQCDLSFSVVDWQSTSPLVGEAEGSVSEIERCCETETSNKKSRNDPVFHSWPALLLKSICL
jgi:hypothetical protein